MKNRDLNIVFTTDNGFILPTCIAIYSLYKTKNEDSNYFVYILTDNVDMYYLEKLKELECDSFKVFVREIKNKDKYNSLAKANRLSVAALYKFSIEEMLPDVDFCLSLDGDIVVKQDLTEVLEIVDMTDKYVAAVKDTPRIADLCTEENSKKYPGIYNENYFNSGIMYMNLKKMREEHISEKLCDYRKNGYSRDVSMNQDCFNVIMYKKVAFLPFKYNTAMHACHYIKDEKRRERFLTYYDLELNLGEEEILDNAYILHFSGKGKPWKYYDVFFADRYKDLYNSSPLKDKPLVRLSYYNDFISKQISNIYNSKTYRVGEAMLRLPKKIKEKIK